MIKTSYGPTNESQRMRQSIMKKFSNYDINKEYSYDEILFILDQESPSGKCDRDIARQLFQQSITSNNKATLNEMIFKYVENLQTSKLCLMREEKGQLLLQEKLGNLKGSKKTYVYLKLIQISAYARHSATPSLSYKIWPSDIPPVTVINSLNPILNHQYTLQLETDSFSIIFYESGVKIEEWTWPDSPESAREGQYHRSVMTENISFELKINYKPINSNPKRRGIQENLATTKNKKQLETAALRKLQNFQPFVTFGGAMKKVGSTPKELEKAKNGKMWKFTQKIFLCMPFLRGHVHNLYYALIALIVIESLASIQWGMEFLDITVGFAAIGALYDRTQQDLGMQMLVLILSLLILIVKSLWGLVGYHNEGGLLIVLLIVAIIVKIICIFLAWIVAVRKQQVPLERQNIFYEGIDNKNHMEIRDGIKTF